MALTQENFRFVCDFAKSTAAIVMEPGKEYLVEARLAPIAKQAGYESLDEFLVQLKTNPKGTLFHDQVMDALTTNETSFFRDIYPFETLQQHVLPKIIEQRAPSKRLSIWSAASSTGQELYSIGMLLREHFPVLRDWNVSILGTDLSSTVLAQAKSGSFSQLEVNRGLPAAMLVKYFKKVDTRWVINDDIKKLIEFRQMNLVKPWPLLPTFDVIFIRNVMIYFDVESKKTILNRIRQCLHPNGYLFLGTAETTMNIDPDWLPTALGRATVYQPQTPKPSLAAA